MADKEKSNQVAKRELTHSERFANAVVKQFEAEAGSLREFGDYEKTLAQHLFLKVDAVLKEFEAKRLQSGNDSRAPYYWENINMRKLALDAVHRIQLGLDALIPNHIHPVPYFNSKEKKYDLDLRVGYRGKHYYRLENAVEKPLDVRYELVYETDHFKPIKKSLNNPIENYEFEIKNPFDRGEIVGGFGYISYSDPKKNVLVIVSEKDFQKAMGYAQTKEFWTKHPENMRYKTLVHRVTDYLPLDPKSVNAAAYAYVEQQDNSEFQAEAIREEVRQNANTEIIDTDDYVILDEEPDEPTRPEPTQEAAPETEAQQEAASAGEIDQIGLEFI